MTTGKTNKRKQKTATNNTKETCIDTVKDAKDDTKDAKVDTKEKCIDHEKDAQNDKKEDEKVNDPDTPIRPSANNGAYSQHFDPIPAEDKSNNMTTVDISK